MSSSATRVDLAPYTTLRLGGPARRFISCADDDAVIDAVRTADATGESLLLLAGGSNLVISDEGFDGTVARIATSGMNISDDGVLRVAAGEDWDSVVARVVAAGYGGLECLSGIPGSAGATPVQNVGAYGVELDQLLRRVRWYERRTGRVRWVEPSALQLGYRTSLLKGATEAVILEVELALRTDGASEPIRYPELAAALGVEPGARVPAEQARHAVLGLRRRKGMVLDPEDHDTWSVGSFFTNPVLPDDAARRVAGISRNGREIPRFPTGRGRTKLSAAWLIENSGFARGFTVGRVGLSTKHTLALTNRGGASTAELLGLARLVRDGVYERYGVALYPEPVLAGCAWDDR